MDAANEMVCVILAGGRGVRMGDPNRSKVCFPVAGRAAIVRAIDTYKAAGLRRFLVVVGVLAEQVVATVSAAHPDVIFVHQPAAGGTGHAAALAAAALAAQNYDGGVMIVMGDKIPTVAAACGLLERFAGSAADVVITTSAKSAAPTAGRVVLGARGKVLGVVELPEIRHARRVRGKVRLAGHSLTAAQIEKRSATVNLSMYAFRFDRLRKALSEIRSDNVKGELYLTDTVEILAARGRVEAFELDDPHDLMGFNTPAELAAIDRVVGEREIPPRVQVTKRRALSPRRFKAPAEWVALLESDSPRVRRTLAAIYGDDESLLRERRGKILRLVKAFARRHGPDRKMILCRAPGRVNLMGRHVDHRGGNVNVMANSREVLLAAAPRDDGRVALRNLRAKEFPPREFGISELVSDAMRADWRDFVDSRRVADFLSSARGDWSHYARAALLRLQHECRDRPLRGMDCLVSGDIPMGSGLSSSSALVVAFAEAAVALNSLSVEVRDFVDLCGEGEWFVGSRGGSADHAAIRTGRCGTILRIGFFPFRIEGEVPLPGAVRVVIVHSGSRAIKSAGARDVFNQRVAAYEIAQMLLRRRWKPAAGVEHLRDMVPGRLNVNSGEVYRALTLLPTRPGRKELHPLVGREGRDRLEQIFSTHADLGPYDLRGVTLYGIGECVRSEQFAGALRRVDLDEIGRFLRISHDGDRVVRTDAAGRARRWVVRTDDATLRRHAARGTDLAAQCGRYACSTEAIDRLVDVASGVEGVVGAQLAGAGLGGCAMVLVHGESIDPLFDRLRREFYRPRRLAFDAHVLTPVAGAGLLAL